MSEIRWASEGSTFVIQLNSGQAVVEPRGFAIEAGALLAFDGTAEHPRFIVAYGPNRWSSIK